jgi:hypothetical protein
MVIDAITGAAPRVSTTSAGYSSGAIGILGVSSALSSIFSTLGGVFAQKTYSKMAMEQSKGAAELYRTQGEMANLEAQANAFYLEIDGMMEQTNYAWKKVAAMQSANLSEEEALITQRVAKIDAREQAKKISLARLQYISNGVDLSGSPLLVLDEMGRDAQTQIDMNNFKVKSLFTQASMARKGVDLLSLEASGRAGLTSLSVANSLRSGESAIFEGMIRASQALFDAGMNRVQSQVNITNLIAQSSSSLANTASTWSILRGRTS